jgi:hypothetical protein
VVDKVEADGRLRGPEVTEHGLKSNAIGFREALIIGIASTAPAYSLAAVIGLVVVTVGVQAPAVLLASFVPMFFVATAFYYMNRADQDCGTTFRPPRWPARRESRRRPSSSPASRPWRSRAWRGSGRRA